LNGKYGLLPYWYFLQSIPKYLENKGFGTRQYNKEEYLKRLEYFYGKIRAYRNNNLVDYQTPQDGGAVEVWKQGLKNQFREFAGKMKRKSDNEKPDEIKLPEDLGDKDKVDVKKINVKNYLEIIKPELDRYNAQIPDDK
ncbi:hypothetical protein M2A18_04270, partial [Mesomycoplasma ovipneumoniae]